MSFKKIPAFLFIIFFLVFNLSIVSAQQEEKVLKNVSFDKKTGVISYELSVPARVRIRIGISDGPLYRTIIDWEEKEAGKHTQDWDGLDSSGTFKLAGRDDLVFTLNYFTTGDEYLQDFNSADVLPLSGNLVGRHLPNFEVNKLHKKHPRDFCHEPRIKLKVPKTVALNKDKFYIIKDKTPIEISIEEEDNAWFRAERYSLHIFIDDIFVQGELDGYSPYTWVFDPKDLNAGKHLILVNLAGFADHYGIASIPVYVKRR